MRVTRLLAAVLLSGCVTANQMFVPMDSRVYPPKAVQHVVLLDKEPTDRPFKVIGLIAPPEDEYDSVAEMINAVRKVAALKGADAVFIAGESQREGWSFEGASGGSTVSTSLKAKAIIWEK
jgi:hypothetical protein